jgi:hypothetical protein
MRNVLTKEQIDQYHRDGYLLVPKVLTAEQVQGLRSFFRPKFDLPKEQRYPTDTDHWLLDIFCRYPESRWLCFHEPALQVLRALLGDDFVLYPFEGTVHLNWFGGWHKDTGTPERQGHTFFFDKDYEMLTVAYYLQDNSAEYGGGLDVEPGTHREPDRIIRIPAPPPRSLLTRIWHQLDRSARRKYWEAYQRHESWKPYVPTNVYSIPSKAGDMVLIDSRINHHATPPRQATKEGFIERGVLPPEREKLAIFFGSARNTPPASTYVKYIAGREDYPHLKGYSYPPDLFEAAKEAGVNIMGPGCLEPIGGPAPAGRQTARKQRQLVTHESM